MNDTEKIETIKKWLGSGAINIFGRPFAGKDFQGRQLIAFFGGNMVSSGEILRNSKAEMTTREGKLTPTKDFYDVVLPYLNRSELDDSPLFLSSIGRWHGEEQEVMSALDKSGHPLKAVIYLDISINEVHDRWLAREINNDRLERIDDTEETLSIRFNEFQEKTMPVLNYYRKLGLLLEIDGKGPRNEITDLIIDALFELASK
ncbi:MAG: nucleoside monophosphate kinase [Candidatus Saccharibacteria bacterium]|nr:nucleoside monophosphate kinase [Candidatus Saccharibacteria bacterium]